MKKLRILLCVLGMAFVMPGCAFGEKEKTEDMAGTPVQEEITEDGAVLLPLYGDELTADVPDDKYRTFYEVFVCSYYDSDGDGIGDLKGLTDKLDYINDGDAATNTDLGCNGIWLMPIMPSPTYHKYDVMDYMAIDEQYGTMEDFEEFMSACEERDIHVLIDLVINHTSSKHPWFTQAVEYLQGLGDAEPSEEDCPYFGYYHFAREKKAGTWYQVAGTDWYYEAPFWSEMPDLNLSNPAVRQEFEEITGFWLDKGVAGFRLDAAKEYVSGSVQENVEILQWLNDTVKSRKEDAYLVAEVWTDVDTYAQYYASGIDSAFDFQFASQDGIIAKSLNGSGNMTALSYGTAAASIGGKLAAYNEQYIDAPFYTNHDMGRSAGYYAGEGSTEKTKLSQAMNLLMSGNAFLYYGEELGMKGSGKDENKRAPMQWSSDQTAQGMCKGPADMDTVKMKFGSLEEQEQDAASVYSYIREVIRVRNAFPEIARGEVTFEKEVSDEQLCVLRKTYEGQELLLIYNLSGETKTMDKSLLTLNGEELGSMTLRTALLTGEEKPEEEGDTLTVPAYGVVIYR